MSSAVGRPVSNAASAGRLRERAESIVSAVLVAILLLLGAPPDARAAAPQVGAAAVRMTVDDVRPNSPLLSNSPPRPLDIALTLTNTTAETLTDVTVSASRGNPITSQRNLAAAIAKPKPPSRTLVAPLKTTTSVTLLPRATADLVYRTKTDIASDAELCLCANAIYPLYFTADYTPAGGDTVRVATAQTYLPSFNRQPAKARIGWLWPLLDVPHRLTSDTVFTDDDLAAEVSSGGRLDQLLKVVEQVAGHSVPMTLITDPDLIDELAVMSGSRGYLVAATKGNVKGTGGPAAAAWLRRLRAVLDHHKVMELAFTLPADPAVESLHRNGLTWLSDFSTSARARVGQALGGRAPPTDIAWPAGGTVSRSTLSKLVAQGTRTVVLSDSVLPRGSANAVVADALAAVPVAGSTTVAAVTSTPVEHWVNAALQPGGKGLAALPELVAELAIRVVSSMDQSHYILVAPPRDLTVDNPPLAVRVILDTAKTPWSKPLPLRAATLTVAPADQGPLRSNRSQPPALPAGTVESVRYVTQSLRGLRNLYADTDPAAEAVAKARLAVLPFAVQRCESSSLLGATADSVRFAERLESRIRDGIRDKVTLVSPSGGAARSTGTYTLTSNNSKLPITIHNGLSDEVQVVLKTATENGAPGFRTKDLLVKVRPNSTIQVHVPTHADWVGRFRIIVTLSTTDRLPLGIPITLTVRSTALGTIGVVITIAAAVVLALALVVRFTHRIRRRRSGSKLPAHVPASTASA